MAVLIVKFSPDADEYVAWDLFSEVPWIWGPREEVLADILESFRDDSRDDWEQLFDRADRFGSSAAPLGGCHWDDHDGLGFMLVGRVARRDLSAFLASYDGTTHRFDERFVRFSDGRD